MRCRECDRSVLRISANRAQGNPVMVKSFAAIKRKTVGPELNLQSHPNGRLLELNRRGTKAAKTPFRPTSSNHLNGPMQNARVESCQFHSMSPGQFGKVQIGKLSAGLRGDSLRRKIIRDKPTAVLPNKFRKSVSAGLRVGPKWKCVAAADSQKPSSPIGQIAVCLRRNQASTLRWS
jgi:hypothetical protein